MTYAFFHEEGNLPKHSDLLNSSERGLAINNAHIFSNLAGILSGPDDLFISRLLIIFSTSDSVARTSARGGTEWSGGSRVGNGLSCVSSRV